MQTLENWIYKNALSVILIAVFTFYGIIVISGGLPRDLFPFFVITAPFGFFNEIYFLPFHRLIFPLMLGISGFLLGAIIRSLWTLNLWTRSAIIILLIVNSCGYMIFFLSRLSD